MTDIVIEDRWRDRLDALRHSRRDLWPLIGLVAVVVVVLLLLASREAPAKIAPPATGAAQQPASAGEVETASEIVLVHVAGAVRRPGLYEFASGARVADAIAAAGGATRRADLDSLNLAQLLVDGTQVLVSGGSGAAAAATPAATGATGSAEIVSLNTADAALLETVPGIGPVLAQAIVEHRDAQGGFASIEELLDVQGIGPATLEEMRAYVTL